MQGLQSLKREERELGSSADGRCNNFGGGFLNASKFWLPPRDSNPDMLIQSQLSCR